MDELTIEDKKYVSSKQAAKITGYAKDYIGQLCREGRIEARLVGRSWYVLEDSIREHRFGEEEGENTASEAVSSPVSGGISTPIVTSTTYVREERVNMPELLDKEEVDALQKAPESPIRRVQGVTDMQSVWQEWFNTRQINASETVEEPEILEEAEETPVAAAYAAVEEARVPIHRSYDIYRSDLEEEESLEDEEPSRRTVEARLGEVEEQEEEEEYVPRGRSIRVPMSPIVLRSAFIAVAVIVFSVSLVGSGLADRFIGASSNENKALELLGGVSRVVNNK